MMVFTVELLKKEDNRESRLRVRLLYPDVLSILELRARIYISAQERILLARASLAVCSPPVVPRAPSATTAIPLTNDAIKGALTYNFP